MSRPVGFFGGIFLCVVFLCFIVYIGNKQEINACSMIQPYPLCLIGEVIQETYVDVCSLTSPKLVCYGKFIQFAAQNTGK